MLPTNSPEYKFLKRLNTPQKIQTFLEDIPFNHETDAESCMSALRVLREGKAHCFEGAFLACAALIIEGRAPTIVSLKVQKPDEDHIIVLFRENGLYGAISKTNHPVLRYRDPVYRSVRELVMSYFHEYFLYKNGTKTLIGYTKPINLKRYGSAWITGEEDQWELAAEIYHMPINTIVPNGMSGLLRRATVFEQRALDVEEWSEQNRPHTFRNRR